MDNKLHLILLSSTFDYIALEKDTLAFPNLFVEDTLNIQEDLRKFYMEHFPKLGIKKTLSKLGPKIFQDMETQKLTNNYYVPLLAIRSKENNYIEDFTNKKIYVWQNPYNMRLSQDFIVKNYYNDNLWLKHIADIRNLYFVKNGF